MSDDLQSTLAQPVVLIVAQGLRRCNHYGLTCVDTHGVEILHVADSDAVVVLVPHHFVLQFLPTLPLTGQSPTKKAGTKLLSQHSALHIFFASGKTCFPR